jgi:hypothetical protein
MNARDIITVIHDPNHDLGKSFGLKADSKTVTKDANVRISFGIAVQRHVPDIHALEDLIAEVSEDTNVAICNSAFPSVPVDHEFLLLSEQKLRDRGYPRNDKSAIWPVSLMHDGKDWPALGRFKEHTMPSNWLLLDRDTDQHTPPEFASLDYNGWLTEVDKILPGISHCARLRVHSSSARVSLDGVPVGGGNGHTWIQLSNADDVPRLRSIAKARAIALNMTWKKPKLSRTTGEIVAYDIASIFDWSVFTPGRLVFVGKPGVTHV